MRAEGVDHLLERDQRTVGLEVERCHDVAGLVAYRRCDRVEVGGELFVVDRELSVEYRVKLVAQGFLIRNRVRAALGELDLRQQLVLL